MFVCIPTFVTLLPDFVCAFQPFGINFGLIVFVCLSVKEGEVVRMRKPPRRKKAAAKDALLSPHQPDTEEGEL